MPHFSDNIKEKLIDDLTEVYANIDKHAETELPFFVCGQYYPVKGMIHFTISDLGVGFFKKINERQPDKIHSCGDAILWAIAGNSTKPDALGGSGLKNLHNYLDENQGGLQIYTGNAGWCSRTSKTSLIFPQGITDLRNNYIGATINLEFNKKTLLS
ncbi:ATP-binding region, ATPase-like protein [Arcticibacter svalbardensis MN12-7]|uniref:ATP-binding region, ATPase-like protein n=2 Tax=Arcticibacter TaxID=1288026 RepID=R9GXV5_9SPHI|nr:ATP-binding region, ATPase-like protein [Arcticibacter svalbardensis MN12-7]